MKSKIVTIAALAALLMGCILLTSHTQVKDQAKRVLGGGTISILTETLCPDVEGYIGPTPLDIRIKNDTIVDIIALDNEETPAYFAKASSLLKKWIGYTPAEGLKLEVDAVSGATFSSEALSANVKAGLEKALEKPATK